MAKRKVKRKPKPKVKRKPKPKVKRKPKPKVKRKPKPKVKATGWQAWTLPSRIQAPPAPPELDDAPESDRPDYTRGDFLDDDSEDDDYTEDTDPDYGDYFDIDWEQVSEDYQDEIPFEWFSELS